MTEENRASFNNNIRSVYSTVFVHTKLYLNSKKKHAYRTLISHNVSGKKTYERLDLNDLSLPVQGSET